MNATATLEQLLAHQDLTEAQADQLLRALASSEIAPALAGALLTALRAKGETPDEIRGFARAMRDMATPPTFPVPDNACDMVGTGGDGAHTYNLSTGAALLAAAAGVPIVKHGNRSVSSKSGAADLLEHLGMRFTSNQPTRATVGSSQQCLPTDQGALFERTNFTFLYAPNHHPAMAAIAPIRKALAVRTIFNVLGPLTNPAAPPYAVIGAFSLDTAQRMAEAFAGLPIKRVFVIHGSPAWDEPTPVGPFHLFDVTPNNVTQTTRDPADLDIPRCQPEDLKGGDAPHNAAALRRVFAASGGPARRAGSSSRSSPSPNGSDQAHRNALRLAAALALEVTNIEPDPTAALTRATQAIDDGSANRLLDAIGSAP